MSLPFLFSFRSTPALPARERTRYTRYGHTLHYHWYYLQALYVWTTLLGTRQPWPCQTPRGTFTYRLVCWLKGTISSWSEQTFNRAWNRFPSLNLMCTNIGIDKIMILLIVWLIFTFLYIPKNTRMQVVGMDENKDVAFSHRGRKGVPPFLMWNVPGISPSSRLKTAPLSRNGSKGAHGKSLWMRCEMPWQRALPLSPTIGITLRYRTSADTTTTLKQPPTWHQKYIPNSPLRYRALLLRVSLHSKRWKRIWLNTWTPIFSVEENRQSRIKLSIPPSWPSETASRRLSSSTFSSRSVH